MHKNRNNNRNNRNKNRDGDCFTMRVPVGVVPSTGNLCCIHKSIPVSAIYAETGMCSQGYSKGTTTVQDHKLMCCPK